MLKEEFDKELSRIIIIVTKKSNDMQWIKKQRLVKLKMKKFVQHVSIHSVKIACEKW